VAVATVAAVPAVAECQGRRRIAQTMKRGAVCQRFKRVQNFLAQYMRPVIDIIKMHFLGITAGYLYVGCIVDIIQKYTITKGEGFRIL